MSKKGVFRYYRIELRIRKDLPLITLKAIKRLIWNYLRDVSIIDITIKKINKPSEWSEK